MRRGVPKSCARSVLGAVALSLVCIASCRHEPSAASSVDRAPDSATPSSSHVAAAIAPPDPPAADAPPAAARKPTGGLDATFLVAADPHFGNGRPIDDDSPIDRSRPLGIELVHSETVKQMRDLSARHWPGSWGGKVGRPLGLIMAGDLTDDGADHQWQRFLAWYGERHDGQNLGIPLYEMLGNHDRIRGDNISAKIVSRHGAEWYSWDWGDLHVVALGEAPTESALAWLRNDLARAGPYVPVIVALHYALAGPYAVDEWRSPAGPYAQLRDTLAPYRVIAIFHGHYHASGSYRWNGIDVYRVGSAKYVHHAFAAVHVTDNRLRVAMWNTDARTWWWWHDKRIDIDADRGTMQIKPLSSVEPPEIDR